MERNSIDQSCLEAGETEHVSILWVGTERGGSARGLLDTVVHYASFMLSLRSITF